MRRWTWTRTGTMAAAGWALCCPCVRTCCVATCAAFTSDGSCACNVKNSLERRWSLRLPAGLGELSAPLHSLIEFLGIDEDLIEVAASASAPLNAGPDQKELATWIQSLPEKEKNNLLAAAVSGSGERWKNGLLRRFEQQNARRTLSAAGTICQRTAGDLLRLVHARVEERTRLLEAKRAAEAARQKAEDEANRSRYLDQLGKREEATWNQIAAHIQKRQPNEYDKAVTLLIDLRDLAVRQGRMTAFQSALGELRQEHAAKESLLRRLIKAKLQ